MKNQKGFSLIELLVVVAILGVLAAAGVYGYTRYIYATKIAVLKHDAKALADALRAIAVSRVGGMPVTPKFCSTEWITGLNDVNGPNDFFYGPGYCAQVVAEENKMISPFSAEVISKDSRSQFGQYVMTASGYILSSQPPYALPRLDTNGDQIMDANGVGQFDSKFGACDFSQAGTNIRIDPSTSTPWIKPNFGNLVVVSPSDGVSTDIGKRSYWVRDSKIYLNQTGFLLQGYVDACDENGNSVFTNGEKPPTFGDAW